MTEKMFLCRILVGVYLVAIGLEIRIMTLQKKIKVIKKSIELIMYVRKYYGRYVIVSCNFNRECYPYNIHHYSTTKKYLINK